MHLRAVLFIQKCIFKLALAPPRLLVQITMSSLQFLLPGVYDLHLP